MRDECGQVRFDDGHRGGIGDVVVGDDALKLPCRLARGAGLIECFPPARLDLLVVALRQLAGDVAQYVNGAALLERVGPELAGGLPDPGCSVGDHQRRCSEPAADHVSAEREPAVIALAAPQRQAEQDLSALQRHAPADQHALGGLILWTQLQIDRV